MNLTRNDSETMFRFPVTTAHGPELLSLARNAAHYVIALSTRAVRHEGQSATTSSMIVRGDREPDDVGKRSGVLRRVPADRWRRSLLLGVLSCSDGMSLSASADPPSDSKGPTIPEGEAGGAPVERGTAYNRLPVFAFSRSKTVGSIVDPIKAERLAGPWEGFVDEQHSFPSGSRRLRVTIYDTSLPAGDAGYIIFGDGRPPAAGTKDDPFPIEHYSASDAARVFDGIWEGFRYPLYRLPPWEADDLFSGMANSFDLFASWCSQRTQYHETSGTCVPRSYPVPTSDGVSCDLYELERYVQDPMDAPVLGQRPCFEADICLNRCACDVNGCDAWRASDIRFVAHRENETLHAEVVLTWPALATRLQLSRLASEEAP